ncbi:lycopene cyclase domain-containing protein [Arthrobacter pigmenti]
MTYWLLNLCFLLVAAAVALIAALRTTPGGRRRRYAAVALTAAVLCVLTAVFDNLMIAAGLFEYHGTQTSGLTIGAAPVEDFAYVIAAALLLPALWQLLPGRKRSRHE